MRRRHSRLVPDVLSAAELPLLLLRELPILAPAAVDEHGSQRHHRAQHAGEPLDRPTTARSNACRCCDCVSAMAMMRLANPGWIRSLALEGFWGRDGTAELLMVNRDRRLTLPLGARHSICRPASSSTSECRFHDGRLEILDNGPKVAVQRGGVHLARSHHLVIRVERGAQVEEAGEASLS